MTPEEVLDQIQYGPLLLEGLTEEEYDQLPGVRCSELKELNKSPFHCYCKYHSPNRHRQTWEEKRSFRVGRLAHCLTFEPTEYEKRYSIIPDEYLGRKKVEIEAREDFKDANKDRGIDSITNQEYEEAREIADAALEELRNVLLKETGVNVNVRRFLDAGKYEATIVWVDPVTGLICKARLDWHMPPTEHMPNGLVIDLKSTKDASRKGFARGTANYRYDLQNAMYSDGFAIYYNCGRPPFWFLAVDNKPPYAPATWPITEEFIEIGRQDFEYLISLRQQCEMSAHWPSYNEGLGDPLDPPQFHRR